MRKQTRPALTCRGRCPWCAGKTELKNRRMKQCRGENQHMGGRLRISRKNHIDRRRQLGERRRNREPFRGRYGGSVCCGPRRQKCHRRTEHLHHDTETEQHDHRQAHCAATAFLNAIMAELQHLSPLYSSSSAGYNNSSKHPDGSHSLIERRAQHPLRTVPPVSTRSR